MQKSLFKSKTFWTAALLAAVQSFSPLVQAYTKDHPGIIGCSTAFVFIILRLITKDGVMLKLNNKGHGPVNGPLLIGIIVTSPVWIPIWLVRKGVKKLKRKIKGV